MSGSSQALWKARDIGLVAMRPDRLPKPHCSSKTSLPLVTVTAAHATDTAHWTLDTLALGAASTPAIIPRGLCVMAVSRHPL